MLFLSTFKGDGRSRLWTNNLPNSATSYTSRWGRNGDNTFVGDTVSYLTKLVAALFNVGQPVIPLRALAAPIG